MSLRNLNFNFRFLTFLEVFKELKFQRINNKPLNYRSQNFEFISVLSDCWVVQWWRGLWFLGFIFTFRCFLVPSVSYSFQEKHLFNGKLQIAVFWCMMEVLLFINGFLKTINYQQNILMCSYVIFQKLWTQNFLQLILQSLAFP